MKKKLTETALLFLLCIMLTGCSAKDIEVLLSDLREFAMESSESSMITTPSDWILTIVAKTADKNPSGSKKKGNSQMKVVTRDSAAEFSQEAAEVPAEPQQDGTSGAKTGPQPTGKDSADDSTGQRRSGDTLSEEVPAADASPQESDTPQGSDASHGTTASTQTPAPSQGSYAPQEITFPDAP